MTHVCSLSRIYTFPWSENHPFCEVLDDFEQLRLKQAAQRKLHTTRHTKGTMFNNKCVMPLAILAYTPTHEGILNSYLRSAVYINKQPFSRLSAFVFYTELSFCTFVAVLRVFFQS